MAGQRAGPQACFKNKTNRDRSRTIDAEGVLEAGEELVPGRQTHLHQLADKLREERVRRVFEPVLSGAGGSDQVRPDDVEYVRDLGLLARRGARRIANPIYRAVIPRELMYASEDMILRETEWYSRLLSSPLVSFDRRVACCYDRSCAMRDTAS